MEALKSLSRDKSIVITRPDKGNGVVLLDKQDYISKVNSVLQDTSKFEKIVETEENEPLKVVFRLEDKINRFLRSVIGHVDSNGKRVASATYEKLHVSGSNLGILYGLPKVHKEGFPIRPILSACNTPGYGLGKYLVPIISPITTNNFTIKDSFSFAKEISNFPADGLFMSSFDVKSLFTNIPLKETINIILYEFFDNPENDSYIVLDKKEEKCIECRLFDNDEYCFYNRDNFRKLLELATLDSHFFFNGNMYKQVDGVAMGSPLGPTLANVFMCHMEKKWLSQCPQEFKPVLYRRYVDDTFLLFKSDSHIELFLNYLNSQHPNISFTCDSEINEILPFLDIKIKRETNKFVTSIYRKPTFTGLMSKFYDFSPQDYKLNLIATLVCRAYRICSDYFFLHDEITTLKTVLQGNGFPLQFIERSIGLTLSKLREPFDSGIALNYDVPKPILYFTTYYLGDISKIMAGEVKSILQKHYPQIHLRILYKSCNTVGNYFSYKDKIPEECVPNLIYKYTCDSCKAFYIGKTQLQFRCRIAQHMGVSPRTGEEVKSKVGSDIRDHSLKCKTHIKKENFKILDRLHNKNGLLLLESLHQKTKKPSIGIQQQSTPLLCFE